MLCFVYLSRLLLPLKGAFDFVVNYFEKASKAA